jgi:outer membrane receptor for ferrienterochelin and colicin
VSFSGSSVAENAYYVNGFNVSNFRNGLSPSTVPFEFYEQFEIKNEAYTSDYGRSTGGVINGTTKSGTNKFKAGVSVYFNPDRLSWKNPNSNYVDSAGATQVYRYTGHSWSQSADANVYASGPILKNKLFYYGLYQMRDSRSRSAGSTTYSKGRNDSPSGVARSISTRTRATISSSPASRTSRRASPTPTASPSRPRPRAPTSAPSRPTPAAPTASIAIPAR